MIPSRMNAWRFVSICALVLVLSPFAARGSNRELYPDPSQAKADIAAALRVAAQTHKRVLLDFGGDWCGDCQVLDLYFHDEKNRRILDAGFVLKLVTAEDAMRRMESSAVTSFLVRWKPATAGCSTVMLNC